MTRERSRTQDGGSRSSSRDDDSPRRGSRDRDDPPPRDRGGRDDDRGSRGASGRGGRGEDRPARRGVEETVAYSYRRRSAEEVKKRADASTKDFDTFLRDDVKGFKVNDGFNNIRIVPPTWEGAEHYGVDLHVHYGIGPDEQSYLCLKKMKGEDCPICIERDRARRAGEDEDYVKSLEPTRRTLFYLVDRDHENEGVQAWAAPFSKIDQAIVKVSVDRRTNEVLSIDDPDEGFDIEFEKNGKGLNTKYEGVAIARRPSSLGNKAWLRYAIDNPLPEQLVYFSYDHIADVLGGGSRDDKRAGRDDRDTPRETSRDRDSPRADRDRGASRRDERDDPPARGGREEPALTWDAVHNMTGSELDALVESMDELRDIDPNKADDDEQLADWICEDLKLKKEEAPAARRRSNDDDAPADRLRSMREGRGR